jgi:uncharacterized membrane protein SpoIIM required for sporulation
VTRSRAAWIAEGQPRWARLEALARRDALSVAEWSELAALYRSICADLAHADAQGLGEDVQGHLEALAARAHHRLYPQGWSARWTIVDLLRDAFPRELRASWRWFGLAVALFLAPGLFGAASAYVYPGFAEEVLGSEELAAMEQAYSESELGRGAGDDARMAGFYVYNNVGIAFRCFATGVIGGLGSMYFLVSNGLMIGTVFGALARAGVGMNLAEFASGHAAWELTAIAVAGAAGMRLGWSWVDTGGVSRLDSLRAQAPAVFRLVAGAAFMLLVAALIEGFWSASPIPRAGKFVFGAAQWAIVAGWLLWGGRRMPR